MQLCTMISAANDDSIQAEDDEKTLLPVDFRTAAALDNDTFAKSKSTKPTLACLTIRRGAVFSQTSCTINPCFTDQHRAELCNMMHPCFTDQPTFKLQFSLSTRSQLAAAMSSN